MKIGTSLRAGLAVGLALIAMAGSALAQGTYVLFESGPVRPLALSPDGTKLFVCNIPDGRLEIFNVSASGISYSASIPVGVDPVAVAARSNTEVWVVNHLSDSVSIVDVPGQRVVRTLLVGDEPRDIVFAGTGGNRAFITAAHRGQNRPGDPELNTPGIGRSDVWVFDAANLGATLGGTPLTILNLFGDTPRALAVSPDGGTVYAAVFHSGNRTTTIAQNGPIVSQNPPLPLTDPFANATLNTPAVNVILKQQSGTTWVNTNGTTFTNAVPFTLPDKDVFAIGANGTPPVETASFSGVGTILFNMAVNPLSGVIYVSNTDANNLDRFEGFSTPSLRGELHKSRITIVNPAGSVSPRHLNTQIDYAAVAPSQAVNDASLGIPTDLAVTSNGATIYLAAFGSSEIGIIDTAALALAPGAPGAFAANANDHIAVTGGGPGGVVLNAVNDRLYVYTRFDNGVSVIDTGARQEISHQRMHTPEPAPIADGRPLLYDTSFTSANGEASCAVCHVFGDFDSLAWDLGDPEGTVLNNTNPFVNLFGNNGIVQGNPDFHPLKGPMTTQTLRGMEHNGPMHWRGDRTGGLTTNRSPAWDGDPVNALDANKAFLKFNPAFVGLLGRTNQLTGDDMQAFATFILQVQQPPSPIRDLSNTITAAQQLGSNFYFGDVSDGAKNCDGCHTVNQGQGFFGTGGLSTFEGETQHFKVPHLRNAYQKVGMFGMPAVSGIPASGSPTTEQIRGVGYLHDGAIDTVLDFLRAMAFTFPGGDPERLNVVDFIFAMESDFAPIVGQQITLTQTNAAVAGPRVDLLVQRASTPYADPDRSPNNECDLVVKGRVSGDTRGWWMSAPGVFTSDQDGAGTITDASLRLQAASLGGDLTYTCVPPGSGPRLGIDRGGIGDESQPDGISDFSQCGDVTNDGVDTNADAALMRTWLSGIGNMPARFKCNVSGPSGSSDAACNIADVTALRRALGGLGPLLTQGCTL